MEVEGGSADKNNTDHAPHSRMDLQNEPSNSNVGDTAVSSSGRKFVYK